MIRMIDYYIKGLPFDTRQEVFKRLKNIGNFQVKTLLEYPKNYPTLRTMGLDEIKITRYIECAVQDFCRVNEWMIENGRPPIFKNPHDTYESAKRYTEILKRYYSDKEKQKYSAYIDDNSEPEEVLIKIMGCTWEEYVPASC